MKMPTKTMRFKETGKAECIHHGVHSEWINIKRKQKSKGNWYQVNLLECRICARERTKRWNKNHPSYQDDYRYSRIGVINRALAQARKRGRDKKLPFSIDRDWLEKTLKKQNERCAYSGLAFDWRRSNGHSRYRLLSIEQKNAGKGYTPKNCVLVCWGINLMKSDIPLGLFHSFCEAVYKFKIVA